MKIYGYSHKTKDELLELYEATISASPETLREIATFLNQCADGIDKDGEDWNHEHFSPSNEKTIKGGPELVVFNPDSE